FAASASGLQRTDELDVDRTSQAIEASGFVSAGLDFGADHQLGLTYLQLRQSEDSVKLETGVSENQYLQRHELRWVENELRNIQLRGSHALPAWVQLEWQYTDARASRDEPNTRRWRRDDDNRDGVYEFSNRADSNSQTTAQLDDDLRDGSLALS